MLPIYFVQIAFQLTELFQIEIGQSYTLTNLLVTIRNNRAKDGQESTFYMTTPPLMCEVVKSFLASGKVKVLNHPPYSLDLSPCDFFLFPKLKKMLSGNKYTSRSSLGSAIYQCLKQIPKEDFYLLFRDWVKRLQKCVSVKGEYFEGL